MHVYHFDNVQCIIITTVHNHGITYNHDIGVIKIKPTCVILKSFVVIISSNDLASIVLQTVII